MEQHKLITSSELNAATADSSNHSGVSWKAIFAGAAGAAALSLILMVLGVGLGFSAVSPWADKGMSAEGVGISAIVWLALTQIIASGLGGYLAGRLRVKWANMHGDEVYFRDTAHGFLSWAVALIVTAMLLIGSVSHVVGAGVQAGANVAQGAMNAASNTMASNNNAYGYFIDTLFRDDRPMTVANDPARGVVTRIFARTIGNGGQLEAGDRAYLSQLVAQRTNLSQAQAEQRVDQVYGQALQAAQQAKLAAQNAADKAKKVTAWTALWGFVALLCGAFFASFAAIYGGRSRDAVTWTEHNSNAAYAAPSSTLR